MQEPQIDSFVDRSTQEINNAFHEGVQIDYKIARVDWLVLQLGGTFLDEMSESGSITEFDLSLAKFRGFEPDQMYLVGRIARQHGSIAAFGIPVIARLQKYTGAPTKHPSIIQPISTRH